MGGRGGKGAPEGLLDARLPQRCPSLSKSTGATPRFPATVHATTSGAPKVFRRKILRHEERDTTHNITGQAVGEGGEGGGGAMRVGISQKIVFVRNAP